jgi:hypothetical protein
VLRVESRWELELEVELISLNSLRSLAIVDLHAFGVLIGTAVAFETYVGGRVLRVEPWREPKLEVELTSLNLGRDMVGYDKIDGQMKPCVCLGMSPAISRTYK